MTLRKTKKGGKKCGFFNKMFKSKHCKHHHKGGKFIFQNLLLVEDNKNMEGLWSYKDEEGNPYSSFFSQLIPVDSYEELADELNDIGFSINVSVKQNGAVIECIK